MHNNRILQFVTELISGFIWLDVEIEEYMPNWLVKF